MFAGWLLTLVIAAAALISLDPARLGLSTTVPVTQVIALRPALAVGFGGLGALLLLGVLVGLLLGRRGVRRTVLAVVLLAVGLGHAAVLGHRGLDTSGTLAAAEPGEQITVLALNTYGGGAGPAEVADAAAELAADVLMLPETSGASAELIATELTDRTGTGYQWFARSTGAWDARSTALLVSDRLGEYTEAAGPETTFGSVRAEPADGSGPAFVAVHPIAPLARGGTMADWERDLDAVTALCREVSGVVVGGDFNATLDHAPMRELGSCVDASVEGGVGGVATWPARLPTLLGAAIDHVLVDDRAFTVVDAAVREVGGSDHRAVVTRIRPVAP